MATKHDEMLFDFREKLISPISSIIFLVPIFEGRVSIPRNGGIWIFNVTKSESHRVHVLMHGIEELLSYEDIKIVKVEHVFQKFCLESWILSVWKNSIEI